MKNKKESQVKSWEIKDRTYLIKGNNQPLTLKIPSRHTTRHALLWFDELRSEQREIKICN